MGSAHRTVWVSLGDEFVCPVCGGKLMPPPAADIRRRVVTRLGMYTLVTVVGGAATVSGGYVVGRAAIRALLRAPSIVERSVAARDISPWRLAGLAPVSKEILVGTVDADTGRRAAELLAVVIPPLAIGPAPTLPLTFGQAPGPRPLEPAAPVWRRRPPEEPRTGFLPAPAPSDSVLFTLAESGGSGAGTVVLGPLAQGDGFDQGSPEVVTASGAETAPGLLPEAVSAPAGATVMAMRQVPGAAPDSAAATVAPLTRAPDAAAGRLPAQDGGSVPAQVVARRPGDSAFAAPGVGGVAVTGDTALGAQAGLPVDAVVVPAAERQAVAQAIVRAGLPRDTEVEAARVDPAAARQADRAPAPVASLLQLSPALVDELQLPVYPTAYADQDRAGHVVVGCVVTVRGSPAACAVQRESGGARFAASVMDWLAGGEVRYRPHVAQGEVRPEKREYRVRFEP